MSSVVLESLLRTQSSILQWVNVVQTRSCSADSRTSESRPLQSELLYGVRLVPEPSASMFKLKGADRTCSLAH